MKTETHEAFFPIHATTVPYYGFATSVGAILAGTDGTAARHLDPTDLPGLLEQLRERLVGHETALAAARAEVNYLQRELGRVEAYWRERLRGER